MTLRDRISLNKWERVVIFMVNTQIIGTLRQRIRDLCAGTRARRYLEDAGWFCAGFFLAAGALARNFQPLALGLLCASPPGKGAVLLALGAGLGYPVFWGTPGFQGSLWCIWGLAAAMALGDRGIVRRQRTLLPALAALIVAGTGLMALLRLGDRTGVGMYLLRVATAAGATALFAHWRENPGSWRKWAVQAIGVLALAQVMPVRYLGLGFVAAGILSARQEGPGAVLAGLALDLSQVTPVKMTAVMCAAWVLSSLPRGPKWMPMLSAAVAFVPAAALSGVWDVRPLPGLILGGALALVLPGDPIPQKPKRRTGEAAVAQVRLEQMSLALRQMEQSLDQVTEPLPDRGAILEKSCAQACEACPERRQCKARGQLERLPETVLEQPGLGSEDLPSGCRKTSRLLAELRRGQEQLRRMKGEYSRMETFRGASREQLGVLADFLQELSDDLARRNEYRPPRFEPEIGLSTRSSGETNGDRCVWFPGKENQYYVLLCDGMGTGPAAAEESREAADLLQRLLTAGLPAQYALRSLNSLSILRRAGGCVTVDLLQIQLDTGKGMLYKWGAAVSYQMIGGQLRKIGTAGPPPGLSQSCRETVDRLSLGRGEMLIMLSDGVSEDGLLNSARTTPSQPPGEMAAAILEQEVPGGDDATAVVIRLAPCRTSES